jgi:hypothetical protein
MFVFYRTKRRFGKNKQPTPPRRARIIQTDCF